MIHVLPAERNQREETCRKCIHFNKNHGSCGTPIIASLPFVGDEKVEHSITGEKVSLCGCFVKQKVKWALATCPVGKWGRATLTDEQYIRVKEIVDSMEGKTRQTDLTGQDMTAVSEAVKMITGFDLSQPGCAACAIQELNELRRDFSHA